MNMKLYSSIMLCMFSTYAAQEATLDELYALEQPVLIVDEQTRALCATLTDIYHQLEPTRQEPIFFDLNVVDAQEIAYPTLIAAIRACLQARWPQDEQWRILRYELLELYDELLQDYAQALEQPGTRRIKSSSVLSKCKILTNELIVNNLAHIAHLQANNIITQEQRVVGSMIVENLSGVVQATNGLFSAGPIENNDLADNSVNANNIVDMSILPQKLAFNTIATASGEPTLLLLYRGTIEGDGTLLSGAGISVTHGATGEYTIQFIGQNYSDVNYQVLLQVDDETIAPFVTITTVAVDGFSIQLSDNVPSNVDAKFSFITLGAPA